MDLQSVFYVVGIVFMLTWFVLLVVVIVGLLRGMKRMDRIGTKVEEKMDTNVFGVLMTMLPAVPFLLGELDRMRSRRRY